MAGKMIVTSLKFVLVIGILPSIASAYPGAATQMCSTNESVTQISNATAFAIAYGYPITQYAANLNPVISSIGVNAIRHQNTTPTASIAGINHPSVDTLYSIAALDLSNSDIVINIPEIPENRYYVFPFYDLWSNNFLNLGSLHKTMPGKYLVRLNKSPSEVGFEPSNQPEYQGVINYPTVYGLLFARILLRNNSTDLDAVHAIQAQIKIETVPRIGRVFPSLTTDLLGGDTLEPLSLQLPYSLNVSSVKKLLEVVAKVAPYNPSITPAYLPLITEKLTLAGLVDGRYNPPAPTGINFTLANLLIAEALQEVKPLLQPFNNNWVDYPAKYSGNFHDQYWIRSFVGYTGYLQLVQTECLYPQWVGNNEATLSLTSNESYIFTFPSGKPPVEGFWSLNAFNTASFLIPNPENVYSVGDRSNLTYPDGESVYGDSGRNDAFSILVQPADIIPPSNWTNNWLPAPAGGGEFVIDLRVYGPTQPLLNNGSYVYPIVTKQAAVTA